VKSGDLVQGLTGPLIYNFDQFKIVQQAPQALQVTPGPTAPLSTPPALTAGQFSLTTFNFENHFDAIDDTGDDDEPKPTADEIVAKQSKLVYALHHTLGCPTVVGAQEVENESLLLALAAELTERCGFAYQVTHRESIDSRGIDVALLSDTRRVVVAGANLRQGCGSVTTTIEDSSIECPAGEAPLFSRPPLQVDLTLDGQLYTIFVNHFKSKREGDLVTAPQRLAQAQHINSLVAELLAADAAARVVAMGDFNDYEQSPAMRAMTGADEGLAGGQLTNVLLQVPAEERYSFVFGGVSQLIDGVLVSPALVDKVVAVLIMHVNADYPDVLGSDTTPANLPYKSTDHDLPLVIVELGPIEAEVIPTGTAETKSEPSDVVETGKEGTGLLSWLAGSSGLVLGLGLSLALAIFVIRRRQ
jgi:predicted extracellular nuclease